jgi:hypothetical protein
MGTRLRGICEAFEVTVDEPSRGDRELNIDVVFAPDGPTDRATIELRMYARDFGALIRQPERWDTEVSIVGTKAFLARGKTGRLRFTRPLPAFVTSYRSEHLELTPVLVTEGEDGSKLRLQLHVPAVAEDAYLVVRGLPRSERVRARGLIGALRGRRFSVRVDELRRGAVSVTLEGPRPLTAGHARLEAVEYTHDSDGDYREYEPPIVATQSRLVAGGAGRLRGELSLPAATAAPASLEFGGGSTTQGIKWLVRFEVEDEGGDDARVQLPLHVGVERDATSSSAEIG